MVILLALPALGAGVAGTAVPSAGGGFAGPTEPGALGIITNPAAAARGGGAELLVDVGMFRRSLLVALDDWGDEEQFGAEWAPQPAVAATATIGRFGVGVTFHPPYARGSAQDPAGPQRFFSIDSDLTLLEGDVLVAYRPVPLVSFGGGLRVGYLTYASTKALDSGASFNTSLDPDPPFPVGDPLLEGQQRVGPLSGVGLSWVVGTTLSLPAGPQVDLSFRPGWTVQVDGPVEQEPSLDLNTAVVGSATVGLQFPWHLMLAGRVPVGPITLIPEVEVVGWQYAGHTTVETRDLTLVSSDPLFDAVLVGSGLAQADFLAASEGKTESNLGWHNVVNPGLQAQWADDRFAVRAGVWLAPTAVIDQGVTPSNVDFGTVSVRLAGAATLAPPVRVSLSIDKLFSPLRTITTSPYEISKPPNLPSGNGRYKLDVWRLGASVQLFLPSFSPREETS